MKNSPCTTSLGIVSTILCLFLLGWIGSAQSQGATRSRNTRATPAPKFRQLQESVPPKREFRAVWIPTVFNITWPERASDTPAKQRQDFITLLNQHRASGFNAVIVQIRPSADAFYAASREPWSQWLTGTQGKNPQPFYDPLDFMIEETHKRGMEFHAWFNPYRSVASASSQIASNHIAKMRPDWHLTFDNPHKLLNPGLPQVREYVTSIIMDVVRNYDIDGVHFDDYFYPYGGTAGQDAPTFGRYPRGFSNIADWRRDNVNLFVKMVADSIRAVKPFVKFGISPFGIWKTGVPSGIVASDTIPLDMYGAYSVIYCDALAWLQAGTVDYVMPQLYWQFGGKKDYAKLMPWWLAQAKAAPNGGRHLYTGNAAYKMVDKQWSSAEITAQLRFNRVQGAHGAALYNSNIVAKNIKGLEDSLREDVFRYIALPPTMPWKDDVPPCAPTNVVLRVNNTGVALSWQKPPKADDGDSAHRYAVYRFPYGERINIEDPRALRAITADTEFTDTTARPRERYVYVVTALDRLWNESEPSARVGKLR